MARNARLIVDKEMAGKLNELYLITSANGVVVAIDDPADLPPAFSRVMPMPITIDHIECHDPRISGCNAIPWLEKHCVDRLAAAYCTVDPRIISTVPEGCLDAHLSFERANVSDGFVDHNNTNNSQNLGDQPDQSPRSSSALCKAKQSAKESRLFRRKQIQVLNRKVANETVSDTTDKKANTSTASLSAPADFLTAYFGNVDAIPKRLSKSVRTNPLNQDDTIDDSEFDDDADEDQLEAGSSKCSDDNNSQFSGTNEESTDYDYVDENGGSSSGRRKSRGKRSRQGSIIDKETSSAKGVDARIAEPSPLNRKKGHTTKMKLKLKSDDQEWIRQLIPSRASAAAASVDVEDFLCPQSRRKYR
jgi:hypothetical protein